MSDHSFPHPAYSRHVLQPAYADAQNHLYQPMLDANRAHAVMLYEAGIIDLACTRGLLVALNQVEVEGLEALAYQPGVEDLFFRIENRLVELTGPDIGGNLQLGRSRNDLGQALARMALRPMLLAVLRRLNTFRSTLLDLARRHVHTVMPGYTHTQPAQPTTFSHYLAGVLSSLERDARRLRAAYDTLNLCPLGAAAFTGSGFPLNRQRTAALLGFAGPLVSSHDCIGASDNLTETAGALATMAVNLSRVTHDMLFWATKESGTIYIDDSFIQISSIMPQKRNPVVLEHLRARLSRLQGDCQTVFNQCQKIPFGDTQDIEDEIWPPISQALSTADDVLELYEAVFSTLELNSDHLLTRAARGFTTATELADTLVREADLPFRTAHAIVARLVARAYAEDLAPGDINQALLDEVAVDVIGRPLGLDDDAVSRALDPEHFVAVRQTLGGAAPEATATLLARQNDALQDDQSWLDRESARLTTAQDILLARSAELVR
ncbi:MAG: argininosuccinate lyase [Chloroflexota bacterium]|nr:argininosuccinate lyase [Chloroflexota bacterium]